MLHFSNNHFSPTLHLQLILHLRPRPADYLAAMTSLLQSVYDPSSFRAQGHALVDQLADYLEQAPSLPANPAVPPEQMLSLYANMLREGTTPEQLFGSVLQHSVHLHAPGYQGHQVNPPAPITALGDLVNGIINGSTAIYEMGATGAAMERLVMEEFVRLLDLDTNAGGFMTNGGTLANLTALLAARAVKWPQGDVWAAGSHGIQPCILVNEQAHYCIDRAVRIMGWGDAGVVNIPSDADFRMQTDKINEAVATAIAAGLTPVAIVGSACTTSTGSFDDLNAIAAAAKRHNLWFHVDGAHGAAVRLDPNRKHLLDGLELADSVIMDFHKMMMTPGLTTGVFFRQGADAYKTFHQKADYLLTFDSGEEDWYNLGRRTFECTKNMMSLRVFSLLSLYGPQVFIDYLSRVHEISDYCSEKVTRNPDLELVAKPDTNIVCFRFHPKAAGMQASDLDHLNAMIRGQIREAGNTYIVQTKLRGQTWLRCTFTNPLTQFADVDKMLQEVLKHGRTLVDFRMSSLR